MVLEFYYMENMVLSSIEEDSNDPYTCQAKQYEFLACLDIAAPSTLSGSINRTYTVNSETQLLQSVATTYIGVDVNSVNLFGAVTNCDGKIVGDGIVSSLDMNVLMWYQFSVPPYNRLSRKAAEVSTVNGETLVGARCEDSITRLEYLSEYNVLDECSIPTRRLQEETEVDLEVEIIWHTDCEDGSWYHIKMKNNFIGLEILLDGADSSEIIPRSNKKAPFDREEKDLQPIDPDKYEVRFARHVEYEEVNSKIETAECGIITPLVTPDAVMYRSTIGIGQVPTVERPFLCPFDVYLWVPDKHDCDIGVRVGSRGMDGVRGARLSEEVRCSVPYSTMSPPPSALVGSPPPSSPSLPLTPPSSSPPPPHPLSPPPPPPDASTLSAVLIALLTFSSTCCCLLLFCFLIARRRRRRRGDEEVVYTTPVVALRESRIEREEVVVVDPLHIVGSREAKVETNDTALPIHNAIQRARFAKEASKDAAPPPSKKQPLRGEELKKQLQRRK